MFISTPHDTKTGQSIFSAITSLASPAAIAAALSDPSLIYLPQTTLASIVPSSIPLNSMRSLIRRVYFTYHFYHPELRYGQCLFRYAGSNGDDGSTFEATSPAAADSSIISGLDSEASETITNYEPLPTDAQLPANLARANEANDYDNNVEPNLYTDLASTMRKLLHDFVCTGIDEDGAENTPCDRRTAADAEVKPRPIPVKRSMLEKQLQLINGDDATVRVYRTIILNMLEQWMRSSGLLRPLMSSMSGTSVRRVRRFADAVLEGAMRRMRDILMPGLYGCTQMYMVEVFWRTLETWM